MPENVKSSKLLALFSTLDEDDKDIVITLSEALIMKYKNNVTKNTSNNVEKTGCIENVNEPN